jgi:hypothetical protein
MCSAAVACASAPATATVLLNRSVLHTCPACVLLHTFPHKQFEDEEEEEEGDVGEVMDTEDEDDEDLLDAAGRTLQGTNANVQDGDDGGALLCRAHDFEGCAV